MSTKPARPSFTKVMSALGTFVYPKLNKPDQFKDGKPTYGVKLRLNQAESEKLIALIEKDLAAYWPIAQAELEAKVEAAKTGPEKAKAKKALAEMKESDKSYKPAYDDDGNETGEYEFNFKMPASFKSTRGATAGQDVPMRPDIFDASGTLLKNPPEIWGGTTGYVAGELRPFSTTVGVGISLRLKAVQIIELRSAGGGSRDAGSYGFGKAEGGYEGGAEETSGGFQDRTPAGGSEPDEGEDEF